MQKENLFTSGMGLRTPLWFVSVQKRDQKSLLEDPGGTRHPASHPESQGLKVCTKASYRDSPCVAESKSVAQLSTACSVGTLRMSSVYPSYV